MKCPYRDFQECIVEQCPSCVYEVEEDTVIDGRYPAWWSIDKALKEGVAWKRTVKKYKFVSCKLVDNNVQPVPAKKEVINTNVTQKVSVIKRGLF